VLGTDTTQRPPRGAEPAAGPQPEPARTRSRWTRGHLPGEVGIWVFIVGDMLVFALFFGVFMVERGQDLEAFRQGRDSLNTAFGAINTLLLLTGSILVVLAVNAVREGLGRRAPQLILGAMGTGALFIVNKGIEYGDKFSAGVTPGDGDFYTLFFAFTGIHLLHLFVGMGALLYMYRLSKHPQPDGGDLSTMESCASYWHLVDLLWVVLFSLFYLVA